MALTDAQKRANKKWEENNKDRARYIAYRSQAKNFIRNHATEDDLNDLLILIKERSKKLQSD